MIGKPAPGDGPGRTFRRGRRLLVLAGAAVVVAWGALRASLPDTPSGSGAWVSEQALLPEVEIEGSLARVRNVRSFVHGPEGPLEERFVERVYDLDLVTRVWFGLSTFANWRGPAHTFLSFEFADSQFVAVSVEARKVVGATYSPVRGLLRSYELMVVVADEPDIIGLRTDVWGDPVHLYPGNATPEQARALLVALLERAEVLRHTPEFYNTLTNNCATNLAAAINRVTPGRLRWSWPLAVPGYSDGWAHRQGLLAVEGPVDDAVRARYRVNERARAAAGSLDYSFAVRRQR